MSDITAVVLSPAPASLSWPGWTTLNHVRIFGSLEQLHIERLAALMQVRTRYCAYIDWDDTLPQDQQLHTTNIVEQMDATGANLTYTDWLERRTSGERACRPGPYIRERHLANPKTMHQLVVVRTEAAVRASQQLPPTGLYHTEALLYYVMCGERLPLYYPHIMYHWLRSRNGMHTHPHILAAQENSRDWLITKGY